MVLYGMHARTGRAILQPERKRLHYWKVEPYRKNRFSLSASISLNDLFRPNDTASRATRLKIRLAAAF